MTTGTSCGLAFGVLTSRSALENGDLGRADSIWSKAAVHFLIDATQDLNYCDRGVVRGDPPQFAEQGGHYPLSDELDIPGDAECLTRCQKFLGDLCDGVDPVAQEGGVLRDADGTGAFSQCVADLGQELKGLHGRAAREACFKVCQWTRTRAVKNLTGFGDAIDHAAGALADAGKVAETEAVAHRKRQLDARSKDPKDGLAKLYA